MMFWRDGNQVAGLDQFHDQLMHDQSMHACKLLPLAAMCCCSCQQLMELPSPVGACICLPNLHKRTVFF